MERAALARRPRPRDPGPSVHQPRRACRGGAAGDRPRRRRLRPRRATAGAISRAWRASGAPRSASARRAWCRPPRSSWRACRPITCSAAGPTRRRSRSPSACWRWRRCRWRGRCSSTPAPRPTTPRSSSCATITTRSAGPRSARSSARVRAYHGATLAAASAHRHAPRPSGLRPAAPGLPARRLPALLPLRPARGDRGAVRRAARRQPRAPDPARGARHGRRLHRRAADGCRRRDPAAGRLLREGPGGARRPTTCC